MTDQPETPPKRKPRTPAKGGKAAPRKAQPGTPSDDEWDKLPQREKFIRAARELDCDQTGEALDEALRAIRRARRR